MNKVEKIVAERSYSSYYSDDEWEYDDEYGWGEAWGRALAGSIDEAPRHQHRTYNHGTTRRHDYNNRTPLTLAQVVNALQKEPKGFLATEKEGKRFMVIEVVGINVAKAYYANYSGGDIFTVAISSIYPWDERYVSRY